MHLMKDFGLLYEYMKVINATLQVINFAKYVYHR